MLGFPIISILLGVSGVLGFSTLCGLICGLASGTGLLRPLCTGLGFIAIPGLGDGPPAGLTHGPPLPGLGIGPDPDGLLSGKTVWW